MRKLQYFFSALLGLFLATGIPSCQTAAKNSSDGKLLQFNFEKEKEYDYEMLSDMEMKISGQGTVLTSAINRYSMRMTGMDNGVRDIDVTYKRVVQKSDFAGMEQGFDTDKPGAGVEEGDPMAMFSKIVGKKFSIKVDAKGDVVSVSGLDKIYKDLIDSSELSDEQKKQVAGMREKMGDLAMKGMFGPIFGYFPNKEVKEGDSWEKNFVSVSFFGPGNCTSQYTVKKIEGDLITLGVETKERPMISAIGAVKNENSQITTQNGTMVVDSKNGLVMTVDLNSDMIIKVQGQDNKSTGKNRIRGTIR